MSPSAFALVAVAAAGLLRVGLADHFSPNLLGLADRVCLAGILGWAFIGRNTAPARRRVHPRNPGGAWTTDEPSGNSG